MRPPRPNPECALRRTGGFSKKKTKLVDARREHFRFFAREWRARRSSAPRPRTRRIVCEKTMMAAEKKAAPGRAGQRL